MSAVLMSSLRLPCARIAAMPNWRVLPHALFCGSRSVNGSLHADAAQQLVNLRTFRTGSSSHGRPGRQHGQRRARTATQATARQPPPQQQRRSDRRLPEMERYYVTCHPGLEQMVMNELLSPQIGAAGANVGKAGVYFWGPGVGLGYRANLWLRAAVRVLQLVVQDSLNPDRPGGEELYRATREAADWSLLLQPGQSFSVDARIGSCTDVPSEMLVRTRVKDAICDALRDAGRPKPLPPDGQAAELPLFVSCFQDEVLVYRDMSGESLHHRGYRAAMHRASLNEAAAAGILLLAGWPDVVERNPDAVVVDPMCGSGTFLIEAALMAMRAAPGLSRRAWPFQQWPDFSAGAWAAATKQAASARRPWSGSALGTDDHEGALSLAAGDAEAAGVLGNLGLRLGSAGSWQLPQRPSLTVTNPPWGQRLLGGDAQAEVELEASWQDLAAFCKAECNETPVYVLSGAGSKQITRHLRMKADWKHPITIGGVDTRLLRYTVLPKLTREKFDERAAALASK